MTSQRHDGLTTHSPFGLTASQLGKLPSFNRRRASLAGEGVRNPRVVLVQQSGTGSLPRVTSSKSTKNCVSIKMLTSDDHLPRCKVGNCRSKAHYAESGCNVSVCCKHRRGHHVRVYALQHERWICFCGTRATYRDKGQIPTRCYWHKTSSMESTSKFDRFVIHHRGQIMGSYVIPKDVTPTGLGPNV